MATYRRAMPFLGEDPLKRQRRIIIKATCSISQPARRR
jgi:hypothetical protein